MSKCACVCVCVHVETCTTAFPYMPIGDDDNCWGWAEKSLERFVYCFGLEEELSKAASCMRFEIIA